MAGSHVPHGEHHSLGCGGLILEACEDFGNVWGFWKCVGILEMCEDFGSVGILEMCGDFGGACLWDT